MGKKLYVGNLAYGISDSDLEQLFAQYGTVQSAQVIMDRDTGRSKGFGFVEMANDQEAQAAINGLNGQESQGRDSERGARAQDPQRRHHGRRRSRRGK